MTTKINWRYYTKAIVYLDAFMFASYTLRDVPLWQVLLSYAVLVVAAYSYIEIKNDKSNS